MIATKIGFFAFRVHFGPLKLRYCRGIIIATTQAKLSPPTALLRMRVGQLICVSLFPTVIPPTEIYVQYLTCCLTMRRSKHSTSKVVIPSDFFQCSHAA